MRPVRIYYPLVSLPGSRRVLFRYSHTKVPLGTAILDTGVIKQYGASRPDLKKVPPYWYPRATRAKDRWLGREILEVMSTEFRGRSIDFYRYALELGLTSINGKAASPETIVKREDYVVSLLHQHEPPVTSTPVRIVHHDKERGLLVVDKPGSIPVHAAGPYFRNTLVEILKNDFGLDKVHTINRLDRLTSGVIIIPLNAQIAKVLVQELADGNFQKEYIARCKGEFPIEETTCNQPLLTIDKQTSLNVVHPEGKPSITVFRRMHYDANTDTSVVHCRPLTGRSHQIRVHLQYLGHPVANDPTYAETQVWGERLGKGGLDLTPSEERLAPAPPDAYGVSAAHNPELLSKQNTDMTQQVGNSSPVDHRITVGEDGVQNDIGVANAPTTTPKLLPRETGHDIGMSSPVPLSTEMVGIITRLRMMKDKDEDWGRWRDVIFRSKAAILPQGVNIPLPPQNKRKRGRPVQPPSLQEVSRKVDSGTSQEEKRRPQLILDEALAELESFRIPPPAPESPAYSLTSLSNSVPAPAAKTSAELDATSYCPECYMPLHPDPKPERLYIFLHALRYTTSLGSFETEMPYWAAEGWTWDET